MAATTATHGDDRGGDERRRTRRAACDQPAAPPVEQREVLRVEEAAREHRRTRRALSSQSSLVPSVDVHTKNTSAGASAPSTARRTNASQSATTAISQATITASRMAPSVAGAGAGAVRRVCQPPMSWSADRAARCRRAGARRWWSTARARRRRTRTSPSAPRPTPTHVGQPRWRPNAPITWGSSAAPTTGSTKRLPSKTRPSDSAAPRSSAASASGARSTGACVPSEAAGGAAQRGVPRGRERGVRRVDHDHRRGRRERGRAG